MRPEPLTKDHHVAKDKDLKQDSAPLADPKKTEKLPTQDDIVAGVPNQEPPTAGPTARIDGDPNKPGEKL